MKRIIAAAVIAAIMAGSLLGCGAGQVQEPASQDTAKSEAAQEQAESSQEQTEAAQERPRLRRRPRRLRRLSPAACAPYISCRVIRAWKSRTSR